MKTLLIMRHAKSDWDDAEQEDHNRLLSKRGKRDAPRMGRLLREQNLIPEIIISSSAKRALNTAEAVADQCGYQGVIHLSRDLYAAGPNAYLTVIQALPENCTRALVVGHNPGLELLLVMLTGKEETLPTAASAHVRLSISSWGTLENMVQGELLQVWRPRLLP
jgi:phosphohistidine phosphatase